ncbi:trypco2 family protein [Kitasatospora sp. NPDC058170]|uniref:trypco2 family protein n=1 Tax=Kitasatospora sp. NPDC058170 TaxID=3346364 RepID=UPI0036D8606E
MPAVQRFGVAGGQNGGDVAESIGVGEAVQALRDELLSAATAGASSDVQFEVGPIELEFAFTLSKEGTAKVGVSRIFSAVVSADVSGKVAKQDVHRVKLVLTPKGRSGDPLLIGNENPPEMGELDSSFGR